MPSEVLKLRDDIAREYETVKTRIVRELWPELQDAREALAWDRPMWWWRMLEGRSKQGDSVAYKLRERFYPPSSTRPKLPAMFAVESVHPVWACATLNITPGDLQFLALSGEVETVGMICGDLVPEEMRREGWTGRGLLLQFGYNREDEYIGMLLEHAYPVPFDEYLSPPLQLPFRVSRDDLARLFRPAKVEISDEADIIFRQR